MTRMREPPRSHKDIHNASSVENFELALRLNHTLKERISSKNRFPNK